MSHWFRYYDEALNDPKIQTLPAPIFKIWINCLCIASASGKSTGEIGTIEDVSFALRETVGTVSSAFHALTERGLIGTVIETFHVTSWKKRQYKSDISTERVKRHRKRSCNVSETPPDTDTDTDTERKKTKPVGLVKESAVFEKNGSTEPRKISSGRGTRLSLEWDLPEEWGKWAENQGMSRTKIIAECDKFKDFWISKTGANASKANWEATWRNWIRKHLEEYAK